MARAITAGFLLSPAIEDPLETQSGRRIAEGDE
jgi:hypothetical protein